jgi:very-short-patch-repair endonuclease
MYKVDFAFCTGQRLVAVEIDGSSHVGSPGHVWKDRHLMRAGVHVVHILNAELVQHGTRAVTELLPNDVLSFWRDVKEIRVFDLPGFVWPLAPR